MERAKGLVVLIDGQDDYTLFPGGLRVDGFDVHLRVAERLRQFRENARSVRGDDRDLFHRRFSLLDSARSATNRSMRPRSTCGITSTCAISCCAANCQRWTISSLGRSKTTVLDPCCRQ